MICSLYFLLCIMVLFVLLFAPKLVCLSVCMIVFDRKCVSPLKIVKLAIKNLNNKNGLIINLEAL